MANRPTTIKTLNQKIRRLARKYGTESLEYQAYKADIDRNFSIHYTKDGILQINNLRQPSKYQTQILTKLSKRKGIKELEAAAKKRIISEKPKGYKPTKSEIEQEVRKFTERQTAIDDLLDSIYMEEGEGSLPTDIAFVYNKIHRHGKGAGSGVSNKDLDYLIDSMREWKIAKKKLEELSRYIKELDRMTDYYSDMIWRAETGRESLTTITEEIIPALERYIDSLST